jgi:ribosomal-protein-alanine N-acetyltransferase
MEIRPMCPEDLKEVMKIERESFQDPWSPESFLSDLDNPNVISFVCLEKDRIVGYFVLWVFEEVLHLANIAISEDRRREGLGSEVLAHIVELARKLDGDRIELEVRCTNLPAIRFYEKHGFKHVRTVKGYYTPGFEDAWVYRLDT